MIDPVADINSNIARHPAPALDVPALTTPRMGQHRSSHLHNISCVPRYRVDAPRLTLSAVVVPTSRALDDVGPGLGLAARLAEARDSQLIILRSGDASTTPFPRDLIPATTRPTILVDLCDLPARTLPAWRNSAHVVATAHRFSDLGAKRNIALLVGRMCGWQTALLLDDDIMTTRASQIPARPDRDGVHPFLRLNDVLADFAEYPQLLAAGYLQKDFDDNSVVCHARRLAGESQAGFISGGALVVRCGDRTPFFPATYNEDWLFFFSAMLAARHSHPSSTVKSVGTVHQRAFHPFSAARARSEELGDVLAEGLFALLDQRREEIVSLARSHEYWSSVLRQRQDLILDLIQHVRFKGGHRDDGVLADVDESLRASLAVYAGSQTEWAARLCRYFHLLMLDLEDWYELLEGITPASRDDVLDEEEALDALGLAAGVTLLSSRNPRRGSVASRN